MNEVILNSPRMLYLLVIIPVIVALSIRAWMKQNRAIKEFDRTGKRLTLSKGVAKSIILLVTTLFIIIGSSGPAWDPHPKKLNRQGRDLVFILDVSKSMLANDLLPNRLQNSKQAIIDCLETLKNDRVGLVLFAGSSSIKCPLTSDYKFFRHMLNEADWDSVDTGGTRIGDAILKTVEKVFHAHSKGEQDIILITDGDDHDKHSLDAVKQLDEEGINLTIIGVGDANIGSRIAVEENGFRNFLMSDDSEIWSKMNPKKLQQLVNITSDGVFLNVQTKSYALGKIYNRIIDHKKSKLVADTDIIVFTDKFQYFIGFALLLLFIRLGMSKKTRSKITAITMTLALFTSYNSHGETKSKIELTLDMTGTPSEVYNRGCAAYSSNKYIDAINYFEKTAYTTHNESLKIKSFYNMGNSQYRQAQYLFLTSATEALTFIQRSIASFKSVRSLSPGNLKVAYNLEAARVLRVAILKQKDKEEGEKRPLQKKIKEVLTVLQQLIDRQETLLNHTIALTTSEKPAIAKVDEQQQLQKETTNFIQTLEDIDKLISKIHEKFKELLTDDADPNNVDIKILIAHINTAITAQSTSIVHLKATQLNSGAEEQNKALNELTKCFDKLKEMLPDQQSDQGDGSNSDDYDEYDKSDSESDLSDAGSVQGAFEANLNSQDIPPTTDDPMVILAEEIENNQTRVNKGKPTKYIKVKKDW